MSTQAQDHSAHKREAQAETQLDRIEQLLRELHRDFRALKAEVAALARKLGVD